MKTILFAVSALALIACEDRDSLKERQEVKENRGYPGGTPETKLTAINTAPQAPQMEGQPSSANAGHFPEGQQADQPPTAIPTAAPTQPGTPGVSGQTGTTGTAGLTGKTGSSGTSGPTGKMH